MWERRAKKENIESLLKRDTNIKTRNCAVPCNDSEYEVGKKNK